MKNTVYSAIFWRKCVLKLLSVDSGDAAVNMTQGPFSQTQVSFKKLKKLDKANSFSLECPRLTALCLSLLSFGFYVVDCSLLVIKSHIKPPFLL